jgi:hypothetical protein
MARQTARHARQSRDTAEATLRVALDSLGAPNAVPVSIAGEPPVKCTGPTVLGRVFRHRKPQKAYLNVL